MAWPDPPTTEFLKNFRNKPPSGASSSTGPQKHGFCMKDHRPRSPFELISLPLTKEGYVHP